MPLHGKQTGLPRFVTIEEEDRVGYVLATPDGGTEVVYLLRDLKKALLDHRKLAYDVADDTGDVALT